MTADYRLSMWVVGATTKIFLPHCQCSNESSNQQRGSNTFLLGFIAATLRCDSAALWLCGSVACWLAAAGYSRIDRCVSLFSHWLDVLPTTTSTGRLSLIRFYFIRWFEFWVLPLEFFISLFTLRLGSAFASTCGYIVLSLLCFFCFCEC